MIVRKGRVLYIDLAHYAYAYLLLIAQLYRRKVVEDIRVDFLGFEVHTALFAEYISETALPLVEDLL